MVLYKSRFSDKEEDSRRSVELSCLIRDKDFSTLWRFPEATSTYTRTQFPWNGTLLKYRMCNRCKTRRLSYCIGQSAVPSHFWSSIKWQISQLRRRVAINQLTMHSWCSYYTFALQYRIDHNFLKFTLRCSNQ